MRRTTVFVFIVFVAGLGVGYFARSARMGTARRWDTHAADLAAIEKLHKKNIEVTLSQDPQDCWTFGPRTACPLSREVCPYFIPAGAEAFRRDIPNATVQFLDTGHFALETHLEEIAVALRQFLAKAGAV